LDRRPSSYTALVLVGILATSVACICFAGVKQELPPEEEPSPTFAPLWTFEGGDVIGITVTRGERTVSVVRSDLEWRITGPQAGMADSARLDNLADQVAGMTVSRAIPDADDPAAFGLQEPEARVMLALSDGTTIDVSIGADDSDRTVRYVQRTGDPSVYLVPATGVDGLLGLVDEPPYLPAPGISQPSPLETPAFILPLSPIETPTAVPPRATPEPSIETPTPKAPVPLRPTPASSSS
jgi:hypothetical protein